MDLMTTLGRTIYGIRFGTTDFSSSIDVSMFLSIYLSTYLPIYLSIDLSIYLSISLSIYLFPYHMYIIQSVGPCFHSVQYQVYGFH